jgi:hypothetical protein
MPKTHVVDVNLDDFVQRVRAVGRGLRPRRPYRLLPLLTRIDKNDVDRVVEASKAQAEDR